MREYRIDVNANDMPVIRQSVPDFYGRLTGDVKYSELSNIAIIYLRLSEKEFKAIEDKVLSHMVLTPIRPTPFLERILG